MSKIKTAFKLVKEDKRVFCIRLFENIHRTGVLNALSDRTFLKLMYRVYFGKKLNLNSPKTFNEKLQWLKLYNRRPEYITMVDKIAVKDYVAERIGPDYIIPTLGVWDKPEDIDWDSLPNQFVLKWNHDSGSIVICTDKTNFNREEAIHKLRNSAKVNFFWHGREWPYKGVKPRIFAEKYISPEPNKKDLPDYKFFCFNGEVKALYVASDRHKQGEELKLDFFDADFNHLPIQQCHDNATITPEKPRYFDMMKKAAEKLSEGVPHVRVDFYEIEDGILFGEMTFFSFSGMLSYQPEEWDKRLGDMLTLPGEKWGGVIINKLGEDFVINKLDLVDYKFMCFNGEVKCCFTCTNRFTNDGLKVTFYDNDWSIMPFERSHPRETTPIQKPRSYNQMKIAAEKLSQGLPFVRIDFYEIEGNPYFGEMTFFPGNGIEKFTPEEWDNILGDWIFLPTKTI